MYLINHTENSQNRSLKMAGQSITGGHSKKQWLDVVRLWTSQFSGLLHSVWRATCPRKTNFGSMAPKDSSFRIGEYVNPNFTECCSFGAIFVSCVPTSIHHGAQDIFGNPTTQVEAIAGDDPMRLSCNQFKHPLN
jgi:hypothetical protein